MLQRGRAICTREVLWGSSGEVDGAPYLPRVLDVCLVRAGDHGVDGVNDDCDDYPEDRREKETAGDIHDVMGVEEAVCIGFACCSVG